MRRRLLLIAIAALVLAAPAGAQQRTLWPGVSIRQRSAVHAARAGRPERADRPPARGDDDPRPGALERDPDRDRDAHGHATPARLVRDHAGVNGDFFSFDTGAPSGVLMRDGQVASPPYGDRSSAGVTTDGTLDVRRISFFGTWQGIGAKRTLNTLNEPPPANGIALYTQAWGPTTPAIPGAVAAICSRCPRPSRTPTWPCRSSRCGRAADRCRSRSAGACSSPSVPLRQRSPPRPRSEQQVITRLIFKPDWPGVVSAIGGGPQIVRNGAPVFRAGEAFTTSQLSPRAPRTGLGQLADGRMLLVTVDGRQPGYSVGMTNFELAQTLVRLGAVTAMALDGGGSTSMAFDGSLLNRPSGGGAAGLDRLMFSYSGVYVQPAVRSCRRTATASPICKTLRYKVVKASTVELTLRRPTALSRTRRPDCVEPGSYDVPFPPPEPSTQPVTPAAARVPARPQLSPAQGSGS